MNNLENLYQNYRNHFTGYEDIPDIHWFEHELKVNEDFKKRFGSISE